MFSQHHHQMPFTLTFSIFHHPLQEKQYLSPVFNETISIVELDEGLDTETFFLFIVLAALAALGLVGAYQLLGNFGVSAAAVNVIKTNSLTIPLFTIYHNRRNTLSARPRVSPESRWAHLLTMMSTTTGCHRRPSSNSVRTTILLCSKFPFNDLFFLQTNRQTQPSQTLPVKGEPPTRKSKVE